MPRIIRIAFASSGSSTCTTWKRRVSAGSFSMYFLYSAQVVARDGAQRAARQRRLQQVGRVAGAGRAAGADQRVRLVDEQDDRLRARTAPRRSPGAAASRTRPSCCAPACSRPTSSARSDTSLSGGGTSPAAMRSAKPSTTAVLPTPASPVRIGLFCRRRIRMSMIWRISSSRPTIGIDLAVARAFGEVDGELLQRLLLAHRRRRDRAAGLARRAHAASRPSRPAPPPASRSRSARNRRSGPRP